MRRLVLECKLYLDKDPEDEPDKETEFRLTSILDCLGLEYDIVSAKFETYDKEERNKKV